MWQSKLLHDLLHTMYCVMISVSVNINEIIVS